MRRRHKVKDKIVEKTECAREGEKKKVKIIQKDGLVGCGTDDVV